MRGVIGLGSSMAAGSIAVKTTSQAGVIGTNIIAGSTPTQRTLAGIPYQVCRQIEELVERGGINTGTGGNSGSMPGRFAAGHRFDVMTSSETGQICGERHYVRVLCGGMSKWAKPTLQ
jgi:hypothetical protein